MEEYVDENSWIDRFNPFAKQFREVSEYQEVINRQLIKNRVGFSNEFADETNMSADGSINYAPNAFGFSSAKMDFGIGGVGESKRQKVLFYRAMSLYPEIMNALDIVCNEAIVMDASNRCANLKINREIPSDVNRLFHKEFDYIVNGVFRANEGELKNLFRKFVIDSELFIEYIKGDNNKDGIIGYQILPCYTTFPIYGANGQVEGFIHEKKRVDDNNKEESDIIPFERNQVGYATWEKGATHNVRGYLESAKRSYNQLLHLEDSVVIYRLVRAPERRLWNIEMGKIGNAKGEEYLNSIMNKYQRTLYYNPSDGKIDAQKTIQSMSEDYWFAKKEGVGSDVQVLQSGMNLGEINDINYILAKLYKALRMPVTRWSPDLVGSNYQSGKQIEREELKFSQMIDDFKLMFIPILKEAFINHIVFKYKNNPNIAKWVQKRNIFDIQLVQSNYFRDYKDMEKMTDRLNLLGVVKDLMVDVANVESRNNPLSRQYVMTHPAIFGMTEEEWNLNSEYLRLELAEMDRKAMTGEAGKGGGMMDAGMQAIEMDKGGGSPSVPSGGESGGGESGGVEEPPPPEAPEVADQENLTASYKRSFDKISKFLYESSPV